MSFSILAAEDIPGKAGVAQAGEWDLVWSDEFNTEGLPDKTKWDYEEGFIRNEEKQYYTRERKENVRVEGGSLVIEGQKGKDWTTAECRRRPIAAIRKERGYGKT